MLILVFFNSFISLKLFTFLNILMFSLLCYLQLFGYTKKDKKSDAMKELEKSTAISYNLRKERKDKRNSTGVTFNDV